MALKSIKAKLCCMLVLTASVATGQEALWRVENSQSGELVPPFSGHLNPFPMVAAPVNVVPQVQQAPQPVVNVSEGELRERMKKRRAAEVLADLRNLLQQQEAFDVDLSGVVISGKMQGPRGPQILLNNRWMSKGDKIYATAVGSNRMHNLLENLRIIDEALAQMVEEEFGNKIKQTKPFTLVLDKIGENEVAFVNQQDGKSYQVAFVRSNF